MFQKKNQFFQKLYGIPKFLHNFQEMFENFEKGMKFKNCSQIVKK